MPDEIDWEGRALAAESDLEAALAKLNAIREISQGWVDSEDIDAILNG